MTDYKELISELRRADRWQGLGTISGEAADAIETLSTVVEEINNLKPYGYYTGTYIKSILKVKEKYNPNWKEDENVAFFKAKEVKND